MKRKIKKIKLYVNNKGESLKVSKRLEKELTKHHFIITNQEYELVISIGGDGTFLKMIQEENFNPHLYYVGINAGTLGFLQEIDIENTSNFVERLAQNDFKEEALSIQKTDIWTKDGSFTYHSLNEIVIRKEDFSLLKIPLYVDHELLENFTGDGLLISTATGSTAYNMSFGGPIIYNSLKALLITPIAPINNRAYRTLPNPIIIPEGKEIALYAEKGVNLFLMIDGKNIIHHDVYNVKAKISEYKIRCLRMQDFHFIKVVNNKIIENK